MTRSNARAGAARRVPFAYAAIAHLALGSAAFVALWDPFWIGGFFYHPKMVGVVHNLTLGWISSGMVALLYSNGARLGLQPKRIDLAIFGAWFAGASGLASHFWIEEFSGMAWSAGLLAVAVFLAAGRFAAAVTTGPLPALPRLLIQLAWLNLAATAVVGILVAVNKATPILPGYALHNVFAHAHLAAIGWAFPACVAVGHVLLLPADGRIPFAGLGLAAAGLIQVGAVGLFVSLLVALPGWTLPFGWIAATGMAGSLVALAAQLVRAGPLRSATPWFLGASTLGLAIAAYLAFTATASATETGAAPLTIMDYGVTGLLGGLGLAAAGWTVHGTRHAWLPFLLWLVAIWGLRAGLTWEHDGLEPTMVRIGSAALLAATAWSAWKILPRLLRRA